MIKTWDKKNNRIYNVIIYGIIVFIIIDVSLFCITVATPQQIKIYGPVAPSVDSDHPITTTPVDNNTTTVIYFNVTAGNDTNLGNITIKR